MPVNMYKGEQYNAERQFKVDNDLFNNPYLWQQLSINNLSGKGALTLGSSLMSSLTGPNLTITACAMRNFFYQTLAQNWGE